jgi:hypothetical protein
MALQLVTEMSTRNKGMHLLVYYFCIRVNDILWRRISHLSSVSWWDQITFDETTNMLSGNCIVRQQRHWWCKGSRATIECVRSWVLSQVRSHPRLLNWYLLLLHLARMFYFFKCIQAFFPAYIQDGIGLSSHKHYSNRGHDITGIRKKQHILDGWPLAQLLIVYSFMCMFGRSLFVLVYFFFWPLCCLFFFELGLLITPLVSSNLS